MVRIRIHTTASPETHRKIEELKKDYKTLSSVIEKAIDLLYTSEGHRRMSDEDLLILGFIKELNFTICAKDHYAALAEGDVKRAVEESMIEMAVKYISKKPITDLSLEELLRAIGRLWKVLNRVEHAELEKIGEKISFVVYHDMRSLKVSKIHLDLLRYVFEKYFADRYEMRVDTITVNGFSLVFTRKNSVN